MPAFFDLYSFIFVNRTGRKTFAHASNIYKWSLIQNNARISTPQFCDLQAQAIHWGNIYRFQIKRKFGLGFLASFIPGTSAFVARINYLQSSKNLKAIIQDIDTLNFPEENSTIFNLAAKVSVSPFSFLESFLLENSSSLDILPFLYNKNSLSINNIFGLLPEITFKNFVKAIFNPFIIIKTTLDVVHFLGQMIITNFANNEDGPESENFTVRKFLKLCLMILYFPFFLTAAIAEHAINKVWVLIYEITINPLRFLLSAFSQTFNSRGLEYIQTDAVNLRGAKVVEKIDQIYQKNKENFADPKTRIEHLSKGFEERVQRYQEFSFDRTTNVSDVIPTYRQLYSAIQTEPPKNIAYLTAQKEDVYDSLYALHSNSMVPMNYDYAKEQNFPVLLVATPDKARLLKKRISFFQTSGMKKNFKADVNAPVAEDDRNLIMQEYLELSDNTKRACF